MSTRRALVFSFLDRYSSLLLSIGASMVIARLLTPSEIGVFSVTMVLVTFVMSLRDLGAGQYLIQEKELTRDRLRAAWTVSMGTGLLAAAVVLIAAKPVSLFYREPRMFDIMLVIALNFAVNPFGSLTYAWLMREMRFDALALMRFVANLTGTCTTVILAWLDWGPMSLAVGTLLTTLANGVVASFFRPKDFPIRPGLTGTKRVITIGSSFSANGLLGVLAGAVAEILLGKLQSLASAALYSRANGLGSMFQRMVLDATNVVAIPMFSREARENPDAVKVSFLRTVSYTTALGWSFFLGLGLLAFPAVRLLYGLQWDAAVDTTRLLALAYFVSIPSAMCGPVLMALGSGGVLVRTTAMTVAFQICAIAAGSMFSLEATAGGFVVSAIFGLACWLRVVKRELKFSWHDLRSTLLYSGAVALTTALAPLMSVWAFGWRPAERMAPLVCSAAGGIALFLAAVHLFRHPLKVELDKVWSRMPWARSCESQS